MEYRVETPESWKRVLHVSLPGEKVAVEIDRLSDDYSRTAKFDGFRAGKVPPQLVKARYLEKLKEEALENVIQDAFREALEESGLVPITGGRTSEVDFDPDSLLSFNVSFEVIPDMEVKNYRKVSCVKRLRAVEETDIDRELERLRQSVPVLKPVDRRIESNDALVADFRTYQGRRLIKEVPGSTVFLRNIPEKVQEEIVGKSAGDKVRIEQEGNRVFQISIKEVKEPVYPDINDDFAKELGSEDLNSLREKIRENLEQVREQISRREVEEEILRKIVDTNSFEAPPSLVNVQLEAMNVSKEEMTSERDRATYIVKREIVLNKIASQENIAVSDQELDSELHRIAEAERVSPERLKAQLEKDGRLQNLKTRLRYEKVFKFLVDEASVKSKKVKE